MVRRRLGHRLLLAQLRSIGLELERLLRHVWEAQLRSLERSAHVAQCAQLIGPRRARLNSPWLFI